MKSLTEAQLLSILKRAKEASTRDHLMILVAYLHGLRVSEVCALTPANIRDGFLTVQRLKGSLKTTQPLIEHDSVLLNERQPLVQWASQFQKNERIFAISRDRLAKLFLYYCELAGIPRHLSNFHVLKHSCAMHIIKQAGIENLRQWLGHKSIASSGAYLRVSDEQASAAVLPILGGNNT
jgi:integrase